MDYAKEYTKLHEVAGGKWFMGSTIKRYTGDIARLVEEQNPRSILDYGSGKGYQYLISRIHEKWGGLLPYCYDVGVRQLAERPDRKFDSVICTDMMEHIETPDIPGVLNDIFGFLTSDNRPTFVFLSIACRPDSKTERTYEMTEKRKRSLETKGTKRLSGDRDVHVTVQLPDWWVPIIRKAATQASRSQLKVRTGFELKTGQIVREVIL